jgi:hypothetical protein
LAKQKQPPKGKTIPLITKKRPLALRFLPLAKFKSKTKTKTKSKSKSKTKTKTLPRITRINADGEKRPLALGFWLNSKPKSKSNLTADFADRRGFAQIFGSCIFN